MFKALTIAFASLASASAEATKIFKPPHISHPKASIGVVWIQGAESKPESYYKIAQTFQAEAAKRKVSAYVAIPDAVFDTPEPAVIAGMINDSKTKLLLAGFKGHQLILTAHSLGTVMAQTFVQDNAKEFLG